MKTKHLLIVVLALAVAGLGAWSCSKEKSHTMESAIELQAPENDATYVLANVDGVVFQWLIVPGASEYTFYLSTSADLSGAATKVYPGTRMTITAADLDAMLDDLNLAYLSTTKLYWTVKPNSSPDAPTEVRELTLTRFPVPIVTPAYPKENELIDLGTIDRYAFRWNVNMATSKFNLLVSVAHDVSSPKIISVRGASEYVFTAEELDALLSEFGVLAGTQRTIYWTVLPGSSQDIQFESPCAVKRIIGQPVALTLTTPGDIQLQKKDSLNQLSFSWSAAPNPATAEPYALVFSVNADMSNPVSLNGITNTTHTFTQAELQDLLFTYSVERGIKKYKENTIYWKLKVDGRLISSAPASLKVTGMPIFKDVRGKEAITYDVSIIKYKSGDTVIWLSNNLRTWNDVDGVVLEERLCRDPVSGGFNPDTHNDLFLKEPDRGLYYNPYHGDLYSKIVPKGWQMPTWDDWYKLYMAAVTEYPVNTNWGNNTYYKDVVVLIDPKYARVESVKNDPRCNEWNMNFRPTGRYLYDNFEVNRTDPAYPQHWFFVFDNTPNPFGEYVDQPVEGASQYGWTINIACDGDKPYCSPDTGGAPVRLIYIGD